MHRFGYCKVYLSKTRRGRIRWAGTIAKTLPVLYESSVHSTFAIALHKVITKYQNAHRMHRTLRMIDELKMQFEFSRIRRR